MDRREFNYNVSLIDLPFVLWMALVANHPRIYRLLIVGCPALGLAGWLMLKSNSHQPLSETAGLLAGFAMLVLAAVGLIAGIEIWRRTKEDEAPSR